MAISATTGTGTNTSISDPLSDTENVGRSNLDANCNESVVVAVDESPESLSGNHDDPTDHHTSCSTTTGRKTNHTEKGALIVVIVALTDKIGGSIAEKENGERAISCSGETSTRK